MFKTLREKISTSDINSHKKKSSSVNNDDVNATDNLIDNPNNSGNQNLSRFSSISSLVSEVSTVFSKTMIAQHVQPQNSNCAMLYENESISEYDDSISGGDTFSKEDLFSRFQRSKILAKRYKTRYLELVEYYKKIESENNKLTQTLIDSQDKQIRRVNELKEQSELDKKAKIDVEENYSMIMEEKAELINVLKLQVNLLKEGKDLPLELEEQIKQRHEKQAQLEKQKDDEIKELKQTLSHRENLLQRCKDKINSLNSQLSELKMRCSNVIDTATSNDDSKNPTLIDLNPEFPAIEKLENQYNEKINNLVMKFEHEKTEIENSIQNKFEKINKEFKLQEQQMKEKMKNLSEENESLLEKVNIKMKIIEDLLNTEIVESDNGKDPTILDTYVKKLKLCKLVVDKYGNDLHPIVDELNKVLNSIHSVSLTDVYNYEGEECEFAEQTTFGNNDKNHSQKSYIEETNKLLLTKIEQFEKLKVLWEEENLIRDQELKETNFTIEKERKNYTATCKSFEDEINKLQLERNEWNCKYNETISKVTELEFALSENKVIIDSILLEKEMMMKNCNILEINVTSLELEKNNLIQELQKMCNEINNLETKLSAMCKQNESNQNIIKEKENECKNLSDKIDELVSLLDHLNNEKNNLQIDLQNVQVNRSTQEDQVSLNVIEMQQKYEQEIEELETRLNETNEDKSCKISNLENHIMQLNNDCENYKKDLEILQNLNTKLDELTKINEDLIREKNALLKDVADMTENCDNFQSKMDALSQENINMKKEMESVSENMGDLIKNDLTHCLQEMESIKDTNKKLTCENVQLSKEKEEMLDHMNEKSNLLENEIQEKMVITESLEAKVNEMTEKQDSLIKELQTLNESLQEKLLENENLKIQLSDNKELMEQFPLVQLEKENIQNTNNKLLDERMELFKEKEKLVIEINEKMKLLETELQDKMDIKKLYEEIQDEINEMNSKQNSLNQEMQILQDNLQQSIIENENLKNQLSDKNDLMEQLSLLNKENNDLVNRCETYKSEIASIQENSISDYDILNNLKKEITELTANKLDLGSRIQNLEKSYLLLENDKNALESQYNKYLNDDKNSLEEIQMERNKMIENLKSKIENYETTMKINGETIENLQTLLDVEKEHVNEEVGTKNELISSISVMEKCLSRFMEWIESAAFIKNCNGNCSNEFNMESLQSHWDSHVEADCDNKQILIKIGKRIDELLLTFHELHGSMHGIKNSEMEYKEVLDNLRTFLIEISQQFPFANKNVDFYQKSDTALLNTSVGDESLQYFFENKIGEIVNYFKQELCMKDEDNKKTCLEYEMMKEKSDSLLIQLCKQLVNIFHLTDINISSLNDITKSTRNALIKSLKDYVKQREQLNKEYLDVKSKLDETEKDLKMATDMKHNIQTELDDLKNSVENDRERLMATGLELENSMRRLNEVADEKGRIDEEKQSLRKELKDLHEKISNLKLEFEKQSLEKQRLEKQFDESLEKVKSNHTALEEMYKNELEKQHGYRRNLEEQIAIHKESSQKISEGEKKLEEVLNQSEQLLELNHQYKKLLDETKEESITIANGYANLEKENSQLKSLLEDASYQNKELIENVNSIRITQDEIVLERDALKKDLEVFNTENKVSIENVKNLQKVNDDKMTELQMLNAELEHLKLANENLETSIKILQDTNKELIYKEKLFSGNSMELEHYKIKSENNLKVIQKKMEEVEIDCHKLSIEKNELKNQISTLQAGSNNLTNQVSELKSLLNNYKNQLEDANITLEQIKMKQEIEKEEMEQQFSDEKSNIEDNLNQKVKKLAKEFNEKIFEKERDFQKTFEEALSTIRQDENRIRNDLRSTIDELNKSTIELQAERNQLLDSLSDNELTIKNLKNQLGTMTIELKSARDKINEMVTSITQLENENAVLQLKKLSKTSQTIDSGTFYEDRFLDTVGIKDHEVLMMHCSDIEEQLKQLQAENISLKKSTNANNEFGTLDCAQEPSIDAIKRKQMSNQPSVSSDASRTPVLYYGSALRSPNMSCSDYNFCPIPITEATDYEYLHDILLKYMTGLETEILAKVVCTVMKFSNDETNRVLSFEQDRNKLIRRIL